MTGDRLPAETPVCVIGPSCRPEAGIAYHLLGSSEIALRPPLAEDGGRLRAFDVGGTLADRGEFEWAANELWRIEGLKDGLANWPTLRTQTVQLAPDGRALLAEFPPPGKRSRHATTETWSHTGDLAADPEPVRYYERPPAVGAWQLIRGIDRQLTSDLRVPAGRLRDYVADAPHLPASALDDARKPLVGFDVDQWLRQPGRARPISVYWPSPHSSTAPAWASTPRPGWAGGKPWRSPGVPGPPGSGS